MRIVKRNHFGFTLIELMVVMAIIAVLAVLITSAISIARRTSRDTQRRSDMKNMQIALEGYFIRNKSYPSTGGAWWGANDYGNHTTSGANGYIPNLAPDYLTVLPLDPKDNTGYEGYLYRSDGTNYKLLDIWSPESYPPSDDPFYDPARSTFAWKLCSDEPACSSW